jgi:glycosyltransferase involved in cell wall biosynthesis
MIHLSILIPHRDAAEEIARLVPLLERTMKGRERPFEIVCIDDGSGLSAVRALDRLRRHAPALRVLRLDRPSGLSAALSAGIAAARGELVATIEASGQYLPEQIPWLIERLARADLVFGRRQFTRPAKVLRATLQLPRRLLLGVEARDPDCLFWAARREAITGLELAPGMHRFLGSLVTTRGFRVTEITIDHYPHLASQTWHDHGPDLGNLLAAWWQRRRWRPYGVEEIGAESASKRSAA